MRSIRANLLLWLSVALALFIVIVAGATYSFAHRQLSRILDDELRQFAQAVHLREDWTEAGTVRIAPEDVTFAVRVYDDGGRLYFESGLPALPADAPQTLDPGYSVVDSPDGPWRMYTHVTPQGVVQVAQPEAAREALARQLSLRMVLPLLLLAPLFVLFVAWVLRRGLAPLEETSRRVGARDALRLDPLPAAGVPSELAPLIGQINALLARLESSLGAHRRFIADAAHELRSPVAALALQVQVAARARTPDKRREAFLELERGIERAGGLVQQLLDLARLEPGGQAAELATVEVGQLVRDVVSSLAPRAESLHVDLGADLPAPAHVMGNAAELRSLIVNLADNALRYAPGESAVTVSARDLGGAVELAVIDEGPGIAPADRERVLQRFQRGNGDSTHGSGLGLAIAKTIAERHHGTISLEDSHPGEDPPGLTVRVNLPGAQTTP